MRSMKRSAIVIGPWIFLAAITPAKASPYIVTIEQVGSNVVATGSGGINLTGLSLSFAGSGATPEMVPEEEFLLFTGAGSANQYDTNFSGPTNFGTGGFHVANTGTGATVGIFMAYPDLYIDTPIGYVSEAALSSSAVWDNATFTSLGLTQGFYTWTWGQGTDQSFTIEVGVPESSTWAMLILGFAGIGFMAYRRKSGAFRFA
jgi:hypothetical protein